MAAQAPDEPPYHSDDRMSTQSDDPPRCLPLQQRWNAFAAGLPPPPPKPAEEPRYRSDDPRRHSTWGTRPVSQEELAEIAAAGGPTVEMWDAYFLQQKVDNPERFGPATNVYDDIARDAAAAGDDGSALTPEDAPAPDNSSLDDLSSQDTAGREAQAKEMQAKLKRGGRLRGVRRLDGGPRLPPRAPRPLVVAHLRGAPRHGRRRGRGALRPGDRRADGRGPGRRRRGDPRAARRARPRPGAAPRAAPPRRLVEQQRRRRRRI